MRSSPWLVHSKLSFSVVKKFEQSQFPSNFKKQKQVFLWTKNFASLLRVSPLVVLLANPLAGQLS